jgi:hypothetical protein
MDEDWMNFLEREEDEIWSPLSFLLAFVLVVCFCSGAAAAAVTPRPPRPPPAPPRVVVVVFLVLSLFNLLQ